MPHKMHSVLFLCTGNSARSIMAEAMTNPFGAGRFKAFSAGSSPRGEVHPMTLATLGELRVGADVLRSKSWDEFATADAPVMDFVITVCDKAAREPCPTWPGRPLTANWSVPDPVAATGTDKERATAFMDAALVLKRRIQLMLVLPAEQVDRMSLENQLGAIGSEGTKA
ncbi:MAG TPA: arsenate reductase ArsC [Ramlibacter sp.]|nr:arsenate reductase ArsC [Ramlibacter sp.]